MEVTCPWGEDERHCVALARRGVLLIADDGTPVDDDEGTLCVFDNGAWSPVCTQAFATQTMHTLCRYMGWPRGLYNQLVAKDQTKELEVVRDVKKGRSFQEGEQCSHVSLACDPSACGRRPLYIGIDQVPNDAVGAWPWAANLFVEDELVCGATLVHAKFIMTEMECATKVMEKATGKYVAFLIGQERRTRVGISPWAQVHWKPVELAIGLDLTVHWSPPDILFISNTGSKSCQPEEASQLRGGAWPGLPSDGNSISSFFYQLESAVKLGERVSPLCLPPLDFDLRPSTK